jgi:hypothetical protein
MSPLLKTVSVGVTPEGSESLFGPKNHSKVGEDTTGSGIGVIVAEHSRLEFPPVILEPDLWMVTAPILTAVSLF